MELKKKLTNKRNRFRWSTLDNAAKVFPAIVDKKDSRVLRFACQLKEEVQPEQLQIAVEQTLEEFPTFTNIIRHGMFWYYLEETDMIPIVHEENTTPCHHLYDNNKHQLLIDISYYKNRINFEAFHAITDGTGAMMFLRTLVVNYLKLVHREELEDKDLALGIDSTFKEKKSDSFDQYYKKQENNKVTKMSFLGNESSTVFTFREFSTQDYRQHVTEAHLSVKRIIQEAKKRKTTVTVFLTALLIQALYDAMEPKDKRKSVSIMIPVNLRSYFESSTVRNFFGLIPVNYDKNTQGDSLETIIEHVADTFKKELTQEKMEKMVADQVSLEKNLATRMVPLIFKDVTMNIFNRIAAKRQTIYFSNLGRITLPEAVSDYVELFDVFISCAKRQICMCSYGDKMVITFAGVLASKDTERAFFQRLSEFDPDLVVSTNYSGKVIGRV